MAHKRFFNLAFAFPALALIIALALAACSNPAGSDLKTEPLTEKYTGSQGTKAYELTITQSAANAQAKAVAKSAARAAFTPAAGDTYVLKITGNGVTQTSSGTVKAYSNNKFTLASSINGSVSFEVTITSDSGITNITGTITVQGGDTVAGPGALTPSGGGSGGSGSSGKGGSGGGGGGGGGNSSITTFTSVAEFEIWLNNQAANTESKPYTVVLVISDLYNLGTVLQNAPDKYVSIDFSGSTFISIGNGAFSYCESLARVTIPNSVTSIGDWAFEGCSSLASITIPDKRKMTHFTQLQG